MDKNLKYFLAFLVSIICFVYIFKQINTFFEPVNLNPVEIAGRTDNNSFGIRNDVYDVIQKEYIEKMNLNEEEKALVLNFAYFNQKELENFSNENEVLLMTERIFILIDCAYDKGYGDTIHKMIDSLGIYKKTFLNTDGRKYAYNMADSIYARNQSKVRQFPNDIKECDMFFRLIEK